MRLYLDESGYTGDDLANRDQPIFVLAGLAIEDDAASAWKELFFSEIKAAELKHTALKSRPKQQEMVLRFLSDPDVQSRLRAAIFHKPFALLGKIVDHVYEPMLRRIGTDIYIRGQNIALANALYFLLEPFMGVAYAPKLGRTFQDLVRQRSQEAYDAFAKVVLSAKNGAAKLLTPVAGAIRLHGKRFFDQLPEKRLLDVSFAAAFSLVDMWAKDSTDNIQIIHDASSNMAKQKDIWDRLVNSDVPEALVGYDRRKTQFPLRVGSTEFRSSAESPGLQLADVAAGAISTVTQWRFDGSSGTNTYAEALAAAMDKVQHWTVWPSKDFTPEGLGTIGIDGQDPIDFTTKLLG